MLLLAAAAVAVYVAARDTIADRTALMGGPRSVSHVGITVLTAALPTVHCLHCTDHTELTAESHSGSPSPLVTHIDAETHRTRLTVTH